MADTENLRLLVIEESSSDAESLANELRTAGHAIELKHATDMASLEASLSEQTPDILICGSGAGLPGVPLLLVRRQWRGLLLEPRLKRWAFLRQVIRQLELDAQAVRVRFQDLAVEHRGFDLITVRALGTIESLPFLLNWARTRLAAGGTTKNLPEICYPRLENSKFWEVYFFDAGNLAYLAAA